VSRLYPALDVVSTRALDDETVDRLIAEIDEEHPVAVESRDDRLRLFFTTSETRGRAAVRLVALEPDLTCTPVDVSDEDWAERSQAALEPVRVGRLVVTPPWRDDEVFSRGDDDARSPIVLRIQPSMGFGTGHHATTRLCLTLLQAQDVAGARVLDVGTGSGVLAIASWRLGAKEALAIDCDPDALQSATENIDLNGAGAAVQVAAIDLDHGATALSTLGQFTIVLANLTGAMLSRHAATLAGAVVQGGRLIVSGLMTDEAASVQRACESAALQFDARIDEDEWVALAFTNPSASRGR
jgi:ribosomal protein L11 methyltransferase